MKLTKAHIKAIYRPVPADAHKGTRGHALIIGGSYGKMGAAVLSSRAALRSGAGLVTAFVPECGYEILQTAVPEAMVITDVGQKHLSRIEFDIVPNAIGIGPGMGQDQAVQKAFHDFIGAANVPLVIDADGLNILSANKQWISQLEPGTVLTPHPKELERLIGTFNSELQTQKAAMRFALEHRLVLVLKAAPTFITNGTAIFQNTSGNAALATAGSGDVLTGIITGLLSQGYNSLDAAKLGVYLHGRTADIAVKTSAKEAFIASDIIENLRNAFFELH